MRNFSRIIQCGSCGMLESIEIKDGNEAIANIQKLIGDGWRKPKSWDSYICPKCKKNGTEYEALFGKPKCWGKDMSQQIMLNETVEFMRECYI